MAKNLVIVESPAKAKTIEKILGSGFQVEASYGHVRDLPKSKLGVDVDGDYTPQYIIPTKARKNVTKLKGLADKSEKVYIATDEDREGEAIGWHITQVLKLPAEKIERIAFHEITKEAILSAVEHPRKMDNALVDAQQARRVLDRLVGYKLSPLLWKKLFRRLSAGRVQSVALRLIAEKEREILAFKPEQYFKVAATFKTSAGEEFAANVVVPESHNVDFKDGNQARDLVSHIEAAKLHQVISVVAEDKNRVSPPPFTTSTLQQAASTQLRYTVKKTMVVAQQLYEGIDVGKGGPVGLITYMRTDSTNLASSAIEAGRNYILNSFGAEYLPETPNTYVVKNKSAQEAHEAIRPTDPTISPESVKGKLNDDQWRLYKLIWQRFIGCQMKPAIVTVQQVTIDSDTVISLADGLAVKFEGYAKVLDKWPFKEVELPKLAEKAELALVGVAATEHYTEPPARYTEASLVKKLEQMGIGRPSTYAPTIGTLTTRGYVIKDKRALVPEELGLTVNDFLVEHFPNIVDYNFTATMEEDLDEIAEGKKEWVPVIREFFEPFARQLAEKEETIEKQKPAVEETDEICAKCGSPMVIKTGRFGKFMACSKFPECKYTQAIAKAPVDGQPAVAEEEKICKLCGGKMTRKEGRFGAFYGCINYPECKNIENLESNKLDIKCPKCTDGDIIVRKTKKGKIFYGCSNYPKCDFASWDEPVPEKCPTCGGLMTKSKKKGWPVCTGCGFEAKDS